MSASDTATSAGVATSPARPRSMARKKFLHLLVRALEPVITIVVLLALAQVVISLLDVKSYLVPKPSEVAETMVEEWSVLWPALLVTLREVLIGFALAAVLGILIAGVLVYIPLLRRIFYPMLIATQTIPKVAVAPLLLVWFGFGITPKVLVVFFICFFPIVISTMAGLSTVPENMVLLAKSMGASRLQTFRKVQLVHAVPSIFGGLKVAITLSIIGAIVGEYVGSEAGIGYVLITANGQLNTPLIFAAIALITGLGLLLFAAVSLLERLIPGHVRTSSEQQLVTGSAF